MHDAVRHSRSQTKLREVSDLWRETKDAIQKKVHHFKGMSLLDMDRSEMEKVLRQAFSVCEQMHEILDAIHWPKYDNTRSLLTDERGVELAARHLKSEYITPDGGVGKAWELVHSAMQRYRQWQHDERFKAMGVNLSNYFWSEAETIMAVIEKDHMECRHRLRETQDGGAQ